jgi:hypothetical protein
MQTTAFYYDAVAAIVMRARRIIHAVAHIYMQTKNGEKRRNTRKTAKNGEKRQKRKKMPRHDTSCCVTRQLLHFEAFLNFGEGVRGPSFN